MYFEFLFAEPIQKSRRSNVLVRCQLELFHNLLERFTVGTTGPIGQACPV